MFLWLDDNMETFGEVVGAADPLNGSRRLVEADPGVANLRLSMLFVLTRILGFVERRETPLRLLGSAFQVAKTEPFNGVCAGARRSVGERAGLEPRRKPLRFLAAREVACSLLDDGRPDEGMPFPTTSQSSSSSCTSRVGRGGASRVVSVRRRLDAGGSRTARCLVSLSVESPSL